MNRERVLSVVQCLPQGTISRAWGWLARRQHPRFAVEMLKKTFVQANGLDMREASEPIDAYPTLQDLFVRTLRPGMRPVDAAADAVVSPADGVVGACGIVEQGTLLQVKGRSYSIAKLLDSQGDGDRFEGGSYATFYLSPKDYHRVHSPVAGDVHEAVVIPGRLLPVFPEAVARVDDLFANNERLITYVDMPDQGGRIAVVMVGATLVGRMSVVYDARLRTNQGNRVTQRFTYHPEHRLEKGAELGAFELGSSVVLLAEAGSVRLDQLAGGDAVRMGQRIGTRLNHFSSARS